MNSNLIHKYKYIIIIGLSNFLFIASYSIYAVHALFFFGEEVTANLREYIVLGMAIFAATQVGGVWLLSLVHEKLTRSKILLWFFRISSAILLAIPNKITIVLGFTFFGFSHAIYYINSRNVLTQYLKKNSELSTIGYTMFSISTNFSYLIMPALGSYLLRSTGWIGYEVIISQIFAVFSFVILYQLEKRIVKNVEESRKEAISESEVIAIKVKIKEYIFDVFRFLGFILPFAVMMALIPIRLSQGGYSSDWNAYMLGGNGIIIILFQTIFFLSKKNDFNIKVYDFSLLLAVGLMAISMVAPMYITMGAFLIWSLCEAYQMPAIEHHLFSVRGYAGKPLNRILAIDAVSCFLGPFIAEHSSKISRFM